METCTRISNIIRGYRSEIAPLRVGFPGKLYPFYPFKYWPYQISWICYHYCHKKTLFSRDYIVFSLQGRNFLTQTPRLIFSNHLFRVFLKSTTLSHNWFVRSNSCFIQLNTKCLFILASKLPFRKSATYVLGCSFNKSSLLILSE